MALQTIRSIRGNSRCADCEAQSEYQTLSLSWRICLHFCCCLKLCCLYFKRDWKTLSLLICNKKRFCSWWTYGNIKWLQDNFFCLTSSCSSLLFQTRIGRVWTLGPWSVSSAQASTGTWAPTCPGFDPSTWTSGRWSSSKSCQPLAMSLPTACGRPTPRDASNLDLMPAGRMHTPGVCLSSSVCVGELWLMDGSFPRFLKIV